MNDKALRRNDWCGGQLLAFSALDGPTDYANGLVLRTAFDGPGLDIVLPAQGRLDFKDTGGADVTIAGDWFRLEGAAPVTGVLLDAHHLLVEGPCALSRAEPGLASLCSANRTLIGAAASFDPEKIHADLDRALEARRRWLNTLRLPAPAGSLAEKTLVKALSILKTQLCSPEGRIRHRWTTPDRWPHRQMWLWDSAFHAIGWRHIDPSVARDALRAVLDMQAADGFVPHMMHPGGTSDITQPPVLAMGAKLVHDTDPDAAWLADLYPRLAACLDWNTRNRDAGAGLLAWQIDGDPFCRSGESGMDNSSRFDAAARLEAVDFNSYLSHEFDVMAELARRLGRDRDAAGWADRHRELNRRISSRLWSEEAGFFMDYDPGLQAHSPVLASAGFLPLLCGAATPDQAIRLAACLADPAMFGTAFPVPSIAVRDAAHYAKDMWRGPVWINLNWMIARGLERCGFGGLAHSLRRQTRQEIEQAFDRHGTLFEFYDDRREVSPPQLLRKGKCAPGASPYHQVFHDYGWTASLYVDLAFTAPAIGDMAPSPERAG